MSGLKSKRKGYGYENEMVHAHKDRGVPCKRNALSGALPDDRGDLIIGPAHGLTAECKRFKTGLGKLYDAIDQDGCDIVFARGDNKPTIVAMPAETYWWFLEQLGWVE